jgi:hypothetical protein
LPPLTCMSATRIGTDTCRTLARFIDASGQGAAG